MAIARALCSAAQAARRQTHRVDPLALAGQTLHVDGYNVLTTIEAALAGGAVLRCRDGCYRDMASMHGSYRHVEETHPALVLLARVADELAVGTMVWYFDAPVSNSGRLKSRMTALAEEHRWNWTVQLVPNPDPLLSASAAVVASADSAVLDLAGRWFNLARYAIDAHAPSAWIVDLVPP